MAYQIWSFEYRALYIRTLSLNLKSAVNKSDRIDYEFPTLLLWVCDLLARKDTSGLVKQLFSHLEYSLISWELFLPVRTVLNHHSSPLHFLQCSLILREEQIFPRNCPNLLWNFNLSFREVSVTLIQICFRE
jgi:hypothetical protein